MHGVPKEVFTSIIIIIIIRDPQISRLAKSRKIKKLKKTVMNMFLNKIKHTWVGA